VIFEFSKSNGFLGYPWGLVAYTWNTVLPAIQIVEITGLSGLTLGIVYFSASLSEALLKRGIVQKPNFILRVHSTYGAVTSVRGFFSSNGHLIVSSCFFIVIILFGFFALGKERIPEKTFDAVLVQQNADPWLGGESETLERSIFLADSVIRATNKTPDMVLFSESTLHRPWNGYKDYFAKTPRDYPLLTFIHTINSYLLTGAPEIVNLDEMEFTNSVILIDPAGNQTGSYAKMHPVPFAEAIPFWEFEVFRNFMRETVGLYSGWVMGTDPFIFSFLNSNGNEIFFAAPICFEDAFAVLCRSLTNEGAEILLNLTNDSWSAKKSAEIQHFVAAMFRAIELRRTLVRSTNSGLSGMVTPDGRIHGMMPLFEADARYITVPVYTGEKTMYLRFGEWFVILIICFVSGFALMQFWQDFKQMRN
jgi:apolipoprotein N-acyltransferase